MHRFDRQKLVGRSVRARRALALIEGCEPRRLLAAVAWDGGGDGVSWNDPDNWSGNALPTSTDDVTLNVAANPTILLFGGAATVNSLVSNETLRISGSLTVNTTTTLNGATRVSGAGYLGVYDDLTVNNVLTLGNSADSTYGVLYFYGDSDITLGGTGSVASSGTATQYIYNYTYDSGTGLGKTLTIGSGIETSLVGAYIYSAYASGTVQNDGPMTFTSAITTQLGTNNTRFINNSTITVSGGAIVNSYNLVNNATRTISVTDSTFTLSGDTNATPFSWDNNGTISANNSLVNLGGSFSLADVGAISRTNGGQLNVAGELDLAGGTLTFDAARGTWGLASGGRIQNGTLTRTGSNTLIPRGGTLDNVTLNMPLTVSQNSYLYVENGITLNDALTLGDVDNTYGVFYFQGNADQLVGGTGSITTSGTSTQYIYNYTYDNSTGFGKQLTFGSGIEINSTVGLNVTSAYPQAAIQNDGPITLSGSATTQLGSNNTRFINNSTITATGGVIINSYNLINNAGKTLSVTDSTLNLFGDTGATPFSWDNNGTLSANNSIVNLGGSFALADIGTLIRTNGGQVNVVGLLDLAGGTLTLNSTTGSWGIGSGGRIKDGTITRVGSSVLIPRGGVLDNVTLNLPVKVAQSAYLYVENGLILNSTLTLGDADNSYGVLYFQGDADQTLGGTGDIVSSGTATQYLYNYTYETATGFGKKVTLGAGIEVTAGGLNFHGAYAQGSVQNDGPITLSGAYSSQLGTNSTLFINNGSLSASGGAVINSYNLLNNAGKAITLVGSTLTLYGDAAATPFSWHNNGTINANNSTVNLGGTFALADVGTIARSNGSQINVVGLLDLAGGTLTLDNSRGSWGIAGSGVIRNGTIARTGSNLLIGMSGSVENIVLNTPVTVSGNLILYVNQVTLNDVITLGSVSDGSYGQVIVYGSSSQTFGGSGSIAAVGTGYGYFTNNTYDPGTGLGRTVTIGSGIEFNGTFGYLSSSYSNGRITVAGNVGSTAAGGLFQFAASGNTSFVNNGTLVASNGGETHVTQIIGNAGNLSVTGAGSVLDITGIYDINLPVTVGADGLLYLRGEWTKSATFDVGGAVVFDYGSSDPSPLNTLYAELVAGYANGAWNGSGIKSSRALANSGFAIGMANASDVLGASGGAFMNRSVDGSAVLVRYTRKGDTNIDGDVDFDDLLKLAQNYGGSGKVWTSGDFTYNGLANFDDLLALAQNYGSPALQAVDRSVRSRTASRFSEVAI